MLASIAQPTRHEPRNCLAGIACFWANEKREKSIVVGLENHIIGESGRSSRILWLGVCI